MATIYKSIEEVQEADKAPLFERFMRSRGIKFKMHYFILGTIYQVTFDRACKDDSGYISSAENTFVDEALFFSGLIPLSFLTKQTDCSHYTNHFPEGTFLTHDKIPLIFKYSPSRIITDFLSWRMEFGV